MGLPGDRVGGGDVDRTGGFGTGGVPSATEPGGTEPESTDVPDGGGATDGTASTGTDSTGPDATDATDGTDGTDGTDATDATDCAPGELPCAGATACCAAAESCFDFGCAKAMGACGSDEGCINDSYCHQGTCIPYGAGPGGQQKLDCSKIIPPGVFFPALQCEWLAPPAGDSHPDHRQVLGSPLTADFQLLTFSSLAGQIVFISYAGLDGGTASGSCCGVIRILDGSSCEQLYTLTDHAVVGGTTPAIGDLDLAPDGRPEIVAAAEGGGLVAFRYDEVADQFVLHWHSTTAGGANDTFASDKGRWNGPVMADIAGDGHPEILFDGVLYDHLGVQLDASIGWVGFAQGTFPIVADVDMDGAPEVVIGGRAHRWDAAQGKLMVESYATGLPMGGHIALADFGPYGAAAGLPANAAEVVIVSGGTVTVQDLAGGLVFGPLPIPGGGSGGPPTVADFDGDGKPEIAAAAKGAYTVFDLDCVVADAECQQAGVLWSQPSQDFSSSVTGSCVFDFEADGEAEAVYGDECFTRVYSGSTGEVLFSGPRSSCTWHENPIVADVDGDYRSEIVVGSNENCSVSCPALDPIFGGLRCDDDEDCASKSCKGGRCRCVAAGECPDQYSCAAMLPADEDGLGQVCRAAHSGKTGGIRVFRDLKDRWVHSRPIWNQHTYHITNVDEWGVIPPKELVQTNWTVPGLNNFRQNSQGTATALAAPDLTVKPPEPPLEPLICEANGTLSATFVVCNRGATAVAPGVSVAVYTGPPGDPSGLACLAETPAFLAPGQCTPVSCSFAPEGGVPAVLNATVDGGAEDGAYLECVEGNNLAMAQGLACP